MFESYPSAAGAAHSTAPTQGDLDCPRLRNICVFCGSRSGGNPAFAAAGRALGTTLGRAGVGLVYGGGATGLMGTIATATLAAGGRVTGIIPRFLKERGEMLRGAHELIEVDDMHARKRAMADRADAFVALPGGIGTLEELAEQMTWSQLGRHAKPVLIVDIAGFWRPFLALLEHMGGAGFIPTDSECAPRVCVGVEHVLPMLGAALGAQSAHASASSRAGAPFGAELIEAACDVSRRDIYEIEPSAREF